MIFALVYGLAANCKSDVSLEHAEIVAGTVYEEA
jgi:hypothetical protein